ncbi:MAG: colanic acid/amylovoran biosynthesis glycosyltransferase [Gaiellaceae bacterium]|nr:colanic acid/amylovoran biosynthesis glycosyltransferase [Gaiellaceae bacterium]
MTPTVAHVNYSFFHSTQSFIYFYLSRLRRVRPICLTRARESTSISSEIPAELADDFYVYAGRGARQATLWSSGLALRRVLTRLPPRVADPALSLLHGRIVPRMRSDADPRAFIEWAEGILRRRDVQIIHSYFGPVAWRTLELKRRLDLPLVVTFLGDDIAPALAPWWSWWVEDGSAGTDWPERLRELFEEADLLLVEGPFLRERVLELGAPPEKVHVQRFGVPLDRLEFRARTARADGKTIVAFAGRFCEQKGVLDALRAVRALRTEGRNVELRLIGDDTMTDGSYAAEIHAYIRANRLQDCVRMLGFLNWRDCIAELQRCDLFLHPSVVDREGRGEGGAPTTIIEAQALGMPVVSTYHCDIPNVTLPGESALLVPEHDVDALADALRTLMDEPDRWEPMGRAGRRHVEELHDVAKEAHRLEDRYLTLLGQSLPAASSQAM